MGKHRKWELEEKIKIVKEFKSGKSISYLNKKYNISGKGTICRWNKEYNLGTIYLDGRGRNKKEKSVLIEDITILKKSYALLMEIRSQQQELKDI